MKSRVQVPRPSGSVVQPTLRVIEGGDDIEFSYDTTRLLSRVSRVEPDRIRPRQGLAPEDEKFTTGRPLQLEK